MPEFKKAEDHTCVDGTCSNEKPMVVDLEIDMDVITVQKAVERIVEKLANHVSGYLGSFQIPYFKSMFAENTFNNIDTSSS